MRQPGKPQKPNRRLLAVILGISAVVALAVGVAVLSLIPPAEQAGPSPSPSPSVSVNRVLIDENIESVLSVKFSPSGGESYTVTRDSPGSYSMTGISPIFPVSSQLMGISFNLAISQTYLTPVQTGASAEAISAYGFDNPAVTWRIQRSDGTFSEYQIGYENPLENGYYIRRKGSDEVFLINASSATTLLYTVEKYYKFNFLPADITPADDENATYTLLDGVLLENNGKVIETARRTDEELAQAGIGATSMYILRPYRAEMSEAVANEFFLKPITTISPSEIVEMSPADLAKYGLDKPARLTLSSGGWTGILLIGKPSEDGNGRYVMQEGLSKDVVLLDRSGDYSFLDIPYYRIRTTLVWLYYIDEVSEVVFNLGDRVRTLSLGKDDEGTNIGSLDGKELTSDNAKRLYRAAVGLTVGGERGVGDIPGKLEYSITIKMLSGESHTIELHYLNDRQLTYRIDGIDENLYVLRTIFQSEVLNKFKIVDEGGDLPM